NTVSNLYLMLLVSDMKKKRLCVHIPEELDDALRKTVPAGRGNLSKFVEDAIREKLNQVGGAE
ncbi:MAG: ribbon-helix-helix protein, CopG family, partial [Candidatus Thorarchaeota archaeon]